MTLIFCHLNSVLTLYCLHRRIRARSLIFKRKEKKLPEDAHHSVSLEGLCRHACERVNVAG